MTSRVLDYPFVVKTKFTTADTASDFSYNLLIKENNLEILKQKLLIDIAKSNLKSSKLSMLPDLNAFSSQGYNFGRAIDPLTNDFTIEARDQFSNLRHGDSTTHFEGYGDGACGDG